MIAKLHFLKSPLIHYQIFILGLTVNIVSEMQCHLIKIETLNKIRTWDLDIFSQGA